MSPYEFYTGIAKNIISSVETSAVAIVKSLKAHTFPSRIVNFPKTQDVKGTVIVGNQGRVEKQLQKNDKTLLTILGAIRGFVIPKRFEVSNFPKFPEIPKPLSEVSVKNFPKIPDYPKEIKISNQPIEQLENITLKGSEIVKAIKGLKLDPTIRVEAPKQERVVIPAPTVTVNEKEIDYEKLSEAVSSKIPSIDYSKLADTIGKKIASMLVTTGGGSSGGKYAYQNREGERGYGLINKNRQVSVVQEDRWGLNNSSKTGDDTDSITYVGEEDADANWSIRKITKENGTDVEMIYATKVNNPLVLTYAVAWADKETLTFNNFSVAFAIE